MPLISDYESTGKLQRKIDIYRKTIPGPVYVCSTNWFARCKDAVFSIQQSRGIPASELFGRFAGKR